MAVAVVVTITSSDWHSHSPWPKAQGPGALHEAYEHATPWSVFHIVLLRSRNIALPDRVACRLDLGPSLDLCRKLCELCLGKEFAVFIHISLSDLLDCRSHLRKVYA